MAQPDSDLPIEEAPIESELSRRAQALVEIGRAKAEAELESAYRNLKTGSDAEQLQETENLLAGYIQNVFVTFAEEAVSSGWPVNKIREKTTRFLDRLVRWTFLSKHPCARSIDQDQHQKRFQDWAISVARNSVIWLEFQKRLIGVAEMEASKCQPIPGLPRESLSRIAQAEKAARERYDADKMPYFPTSPDFSFVEESIFRSIGVVLEYVRIFAEDVSEAHLREYLETAPSNLLTNGALLQTIVSNVSSRTDELWTGYGNVLRFEPSERRARSIIALAQGSINQHPELGTWRYPEKGQWAKFMARMAEPDSEMAHANVQYTTTIQKAISDRVKQYQDLARSRLKAKGSEAQGEKNAGRESATPPVAETGSEFTTAGNRTGEADPAVQQSELPRHIRAPLEDEVILPGRELAPDPESGVTAGSLPGNHRLFRRSGDMWVLAFDGKTVYVRHIKGMEYIAHLLRSPDQHVHSVQLLMAAVDKRKAPVLGSAGKTLDQTAINHYRSRAEDLEVDLAEAERFQDTGRKEAAQAELDHLAGQFLSATGLGGRHRNAHDDAEKIRKGVGNAITRALDAIRKHHPALAHHLKRSIDQGSIVMYQGDGIDWQF